LEKLIEVDRHSQRVVAYEGSKRVFQFDCFTGDLQTPTNPGTFRITWKDRWHVSQEYHRPMPYALFFDRGRAIHGGHHVEMRHLLMSAGLGRLDSVLPESAKIASHGCVNLKDVDAAKLFEWASEGTRVLVR
jgi:lipoprotein-anchoring transpeptidase ErfK/SrfK